MRLHNLIRVSLVTNIKFEVDNKILDMYVRCVLFT